MLGSRGGGGQKHSGRGGDVLAAVMFADTKDVETDLIGKFDLLKQIAHTFGGADSETRGGIGRHFHKAVNAYLQSVWFSLLRAFLPLFTQ